MDSSTAESKMAKSPTSNDPLTDILAPAATALTCTTPDSKAEERAPEINSNHPLAGPVDGPKDPLQQPPTQRMSEPHAQELSRNDATSKHSGSQETVETRNSSSAGFSGRQSSINNRTGQFKEILAMDIIDLDRLKAMSRGGIPDKDGIRATAWKLLLNYLPPKKKQWERTLREKRASYNVFCQELIVDPKTGTVGPQDDHPLSLNHDSRWNAYFKDAEMMEQIDRDVMRTHPDMHFFSGSDGAAVTHREEMKRALFVFAKLNRGLRYVQGMNELLAPIYYQFRNDVEESNREHAEADAFFCFLELISEFRDHFCQQLDNSKIGIRATLTRLSDLLQQKDEALWSHVQIKNKVNPQFYAFRWITLLLTQEFPFPDCVRLWDTLLSDKASRFDCLLKCCCAMLINVRDELLQGDFSQNLKMLQRYPPVDVHGILLRAASL